MNHGYVKLWRKSLACGMMQNPELWVFWCWCLMKATHREVKTVCGYQEVTLQPGQFIFGRKSAAKELPLSEQNIRTILLFLKKTQKLTIKTTNKYSIISIVNWHTYQAEQPESNQQTNQPLTNNQPTTNHKQEQKNKKNTTLSGNPDDAPLKSSKSEKIPVDEIVKYLNLKTSKNFRANAKHTQTHIKARFAEGFILPDFIKVIDRKAAQWSCDSKMSDYLRPETLFGSKFESYLNESCETASPINHMREFRADDELRGDQ